MGKIIQRVPAVAAGAQAGQAVEVLFDSGASSSLIRRDCALALGAQLQTIRRTRRFRLANGEPGLASNTLCTLELELKGKQIDGNFYVVDRLPREVVVGVDFMQRWDIRLFPQREDYEVGVDPDAIELM